MRRKRIAAVAAVVYLISVFGSIGALADGEGMTLSESELGRMCVAAVYPASRGGRDLDRIRGEGLGEGENKEADAPRSGDAGKSEAEKTEKAENASENAGEPLSQKIVSPPVIPEIHEKEPLVILYHTHATEAYQPISTGNFRTTEEEGSVRDVGNVLTEELEKLGIHVIHDKTLHDAESYNQSYSRSLSTVQNLMGQYPSAIFVIDLHRDAAAYTGNVGKTVTVEGETAAAYALVVGEGNPNAAMLRSFAQRVNEKAEAMYPGFGGRIISKTYKYNQYVSDYHLLLEVGNNENNIRETRVTAKYFARVLASVIAEVL